MPLPDLDSYPLTYRIAYRITCRKDNATSEVEGEKRLSCGENRKRKGRKERRIEKMDKPLRIAVAVLGCGEELALIVQAPDQDRGFNEQSNNTMG
jgi:hypothetical protein